MSSSYLKQEKEENGQVISELMKKVEEENGQVISELMKKVEKGVKKENDLLMEIDALVDELVREEKDIEMLTQQRESLDANLNQDQQEAVNFYDTQLRHSLVIKMKWRKQKWKPKILLWTCEGN